MNQDRKVRGIAAVVRPCLDMTDVTRKGSNGLLRN
jgi:hypothetical protein